VTNLAQNQLDAAAGVGVGAVVVGAGSPDDPVTRERLEQEVDAR
jgi:hypothetical protein